MSIKAFLSKIGVLLQSTEMFEQPRKKIPGKWQLYEYFVDEKDKLTHFQEGDLLKNKEFFEIEFSEKSFTYSSNLSVSFVRNIKQGKWDVAKNFVTLIDEDNFRNSNKCQFAFEKGRMKLLKKDSIGNIEFFGFFRKLNLES